MAKKARYRARHPEKVAAYKKWYQETHRDRVAEAHKRYREKHRARVAEAQKRYRERHPEQCQAYDKRYRETHRAQLREKERRRRARLAEVHKRYREQHREHRREYLAKKRDQEKKRTVEKLKALGPLKLTITLMDYLKSPSGRTPVTTYVKAFCDSLESLSVDTNVCQSVSENSSAFCDSLESLSVDTNVCESPTESFLQLLEKDSHTLIDLDSGAMQVVEPPDCDFDDLSFLQDISSDEWADLLEDVEDSSFDLEALVPPEGIIDFLEDMSSSDEGIDLMYDLVT